MTCFQLIFSPTGGTERVAKALTETWPNVQTIDLSAQNFTAPAVPFGKDDLVLIAMPAFEAMAPQPALDRLALLQGNGARCALAAVYGNRAVDNTLAQDGALLLAVEGRCVILVLHDEAFGIIGAKHFLSFSFVDLFQLFHC